MSKAAYWAKKLSKYNDADWAGQPSLFVQEAVKFYPTNARVLEIGTGTGNDGLWLAQEGYKVTMTDFIDDLFPTINEEAASEGVRVELKKLDVRELSELSSESFDVVHANLSLHYFDMATTKQIFAEIKRILTPGGVLSALCNSTDDSECGEGEEIEQNYYKINEIEKRFLDVDTAKELSHEFNPLAIDNRGETYKDRAIGVRNLIRIIVKKGN
ncbi:MAG: hypothetical protein QG553_372 [Patescibacteria group bacterium]|nr:hypothetical protein [Patescibacteria group bacterium]